MKNKRLIGLSLILISLTAFGQQTEVRKDSMDRIFHLPPEQKQTVRMTKESFILPDLNILPKANKSRILQDSMTFHVSAPEAIDVPWPSKKLGTFFDPFINDYNRSDDFRINTNSYLSTYSQYNTYPTMGVHIQAGAIYTYMPNERWELSGGIFSSKYTIPSFVHGSKIDFGLNASASYLINDYLRIRAYGQYSINGEKNAVQGYMTPMYPQSNYGVTMQIRLNDYVDIIGGVERSYNPIKRKWDTYPVFQPVIYWKGRR